MDHQTTPETATPQTPTKKTILNYGFLMAILSIALQVISYVLDAHIDRPWWLSVLQMAITIGVVVYGIRAYKLDNNGFLSLSQALKVGIGISLIAALIIAVFNYIFITFIEPDFIEQTMDFTRMKMEEGGQLTSEQMEMSLNMTRRFMSPWIINAIAILGALFFGFIISLIAGLAMRKTPPVSL